MSSQDLSPEERKERLEHRDVLLAVRALLKSDSGRIFFKYLFKHYDVAQMPEIGLEGMWLYERLGFLRAGNAIFKLIAEADVETAASLLAQIEKERYAELIEFAQAGRETE